MNVTSIKNNMAPKIGGKLYPVICLFASFLWTTFLFTCCNNDKLGQLRYQNLEFALSMGGFIRQKKTRKTERKGEATNGPVARFLLASQNKISRDFRFSLQWVWRWPPSEMLWRVMTVEAKSTSETSTSFCETTRCGIPKESIFKTSYSPKPPAVQNVSHWFSIDTQIKPMQFLCNPHIRKWTGSRR